MAFRTPILMGDSVAMSLTETIPKLGDAELATLYANALRLQGAEGRHRRAAADLVPLIEIELSVCSAARPSVTSKPRPSRVRKGLTAVAAS
jgi:hypothetical protein